MYVNEEHYEKQLYSIVVTEFVIEIDANEEHLEKQWS
jgi:hypothetical protein